MNFLEYQIEADRTRNYKSEELLNGILGVIGESGEIVDLFKKYHFQDHDLNETKKKMAEEIGDLLWYLSLISRNIGVSLEKIAEANIEKLKKRYPDGFDAERSKNRE